MVFGEERDDVAHLDIVSASRALAFVPSWKAHCWGSYQGVRELVVVACNWLGDSCTAGETEAGACHVMVLVVGGAVRQDVGVGVSRLDGGLNDSRLGVVAEEGDVRFVEMSELGVSLAEMGDVAHLFLDAVDVGDVVRVM